MWEEKTLFFYSTSDKNDNYRFIIDITLSEPKSIQLGGCIGLNGLSLYLLWLNIDIFW